MPASTTQPGRKTSQNVAGAATGRQAGSNGNFVSPISLKDASLYINRELSLLAFQRRGVEEGQDETKPPPQPGEILLIFGSHHGEFFLFPGAGVKNPPETATV